MKRENYHTLGDADVAKEIREKRESIRTLHFDIAGGRGKNTKSIRAARKAIARLLTEVGRRARAH